MRFNTYNSEMIMKIMCALLILLSSCKNETIQESKLGGKWHLSSVIEKTYFQSTDFFHNDEILFLPNGNYEKKYSEGDIRTKSEGQYKVYENSAGVIVTLTPDTIYKNHEGDTLHLFTLSNNKTILIHNIKVKWQYNGGIEEIAKYSYCYEKQ
jgi:hypothetical protein